MVKYAFQLKEDLEKKLEALCLMHEQPEWHVGVYFTGLRNEIDLDAEKTMDALGASSSGAANVNASRCEYIRILDELESRVLKQLPKSEKVNSIEALASFKKRVEHFPSLDEEGDEIEDAYLELALAIIEATNQLEKRLLGEQTTIYVHSRFRGVLGSLVHFGDVYLSPHEVAHFKYLNLEYNDSLMSYHRSTLKYLNSSLLVPVSKPLILTKSHLVIKDIHMNYRMTTGTMFFCVAESEEDYTGFKADGFKVKREFVHYQQGENDTRQWIEDLDGVDSSVGLFDTYTTDECSMYLQNPVLEFDDRLLPSPFTHLARLVLIDVHLESFDADLLAQCVNLWYLDLRVSVSEGVVFNLDFLKSLPALEEVFLTLPDAPVDFSVFGKMEMLRELTLRRSPGSKEPHILTVNDLSSFTWGGIEELSLSGFKIDPESAVDDPYYLEHTAYSLQLTTFASGLRSVSMKNTEFPGLTCNLSCFDSGETVYTLDLAGTKITSLTSSKSCFVWEYPKKLGYIGMQSCDIGDLPQGAFDRFVNLHDLNLSKNRLGQLNGTLFNRLVNLKSLNIGDNPIETIESEVFDGLRMLKELYLERCKLKELSAAMFKDLVKLEKLFLNANQIEELDLNCFCHLEQLKLLNLASNKINKLSEKAKPRLLLNLEELNLAENQLSHIDNFAFSESTKLNVLDLSKNKLTELDKDFFAPFSQMKKLDFSNNNLTITITETTFASCRETLRQIAMSGNESIRFDGDLSKIFGGFGFLECDLSTSFTGLSKPRSLSFRNPAPGALEAFFSNHKNRTSLQNLYSLSLKGCSIRELIFISINSSVKDQAERGVFSMDWLRQIERLTEIDFSGNHIETLEDEFIFLGFSHLNSVNLSNNRIKLIERSVFTYTPELKTLDLSMNNLSSIELGLFRGLIHLTKLDLSGNSLTHLNIGKLLKVCPSLKSLHLADNQLDDRSADEASMGKCNRLRELVLANNRLENMGFVRKIFNLRKLDLSNNRIETVESDGFYPLSPLISLIHLDLSGNRIKSLRDELVSQLKLILEHFDISNNQL